MPVEKIYIDKVLDITTCRENSSYKELFIDKNSIDQYINVLNEIEKKIEDLIHNVYIEISEPLINNLSKVLELYREKPLYTSLTGFSLKNKRLFEIIEEIFKCGEK